MRRLVALLLWLAVPAHAETRLLMAEEVGCMWCARWNAEIGPIYPKTDAGKAAPLMRVNIRDDLPEGVTLTRPLSFTPTFVLLDDGTEVGRIEGYPGEDFFWGLLERMLDTSDLGGPFPQPAG